MAAATTRKVSDIQPVKAIHSKGVPNTRSLLSSSRYLEFNLLYDRGVKFGLANENPRVEGVMVSAPPLIAWEYNHKIEKGSEEERLMKILKKPKKWA